MVAGRRINLAEPTQRKLNFFFGGGFAGAAGQTDHDSFKTRTVKSADFAKRFQTVRYHDLTFRRRTGHQMLHQRQRGTVLQHFADKVMSVKFFAAQRHKQHTRSSLTAVCYHSVKFGRDNI